MSVYLRGSMRCFANMPQDHIFDMQKRMNPLEGDVVESGLDAVPLSTGRGRCKGHFGQDGVCQLAGFLLLGIVQLLNVIATYAARSSPSLLALYRQE